MTCFIEESPRLTSSLPDAIASSPSVGSGFHAAHTGHCLLAICVANGPRSPFGHIDVR